MTGHWNNRVVKTKMPDGEYFYQIHEVFYDDNGKASLCTESGISPCGDDIDELKKSYEMMAEAFKAPVLDYDEIPERLAKEI